MKQAIVILMGGVACAVSLGCAAQADEPAADSAAATTRAGVNVVQVAEYPDFGASILYANGRVYAPSVYDRTVRVFDATTHAEGSPIAVGRGPIRMTVSGNSLYVVNQWAQDTGDAYISIVDTLTQRVTRSLSVAIKREGPDPNNYPTTGFPQDATLLNNQLFVTFPTNPVPNAMAIDLGSWREHRMVAAGSGPWRLTNAGNELVVTNGRAIGNPDDDAILEMDPSGRILATHETPGWLGQAISVGGKAWVARGLAYKAGGLVMIVDPQTHTTREVAVGDRPEGLAESGGKIYVMCRGSKQIDVIDVASERVVESIDLSQTNPFITDPRGIAVTPSGALYVRSVDASTWQPTTQIFVITRT